MPHKPPWMAHKGLFSRKPTVVFEGQQPGEPGALFMGVFALTKPLQMVNRRAVWQAAGGQDWYAFGMHSGVPQW